MKRSSRREFIQLSTGAALATIGSKYFGEKKTPLNLSFSTLGCPDWTFIQIADFAKQHGYSGIELRGIKRQLDLPKCPELNSDQSRKETLSLMKERGLKFVDLGSSATMHILDDSERKKTMDEGRSFIDLAKQINCPYVRVYPNRFPKEEEKSVVIDRIAKGLRELGDYAKDKDVMILMETHGDALWADDLFKIMQQADHKQVALVWDICNMWTVTKESPTEVYKKLAKYIRHTHIKDARLINNEPHYVLLGRGEVPIFEAIDLLRNNGYKGYYSFEWEKLWHPELDEPEMVFADYPDAMKKHLSK